MCFAFNGTLSSLNRNIHSGFNSDQYKIFNCEIRFGVRRLKEARFPSHWEGICPSLLTRHLEMAERMTPGTAEVCSRHGSDELRSATQEGSKSLPYLTASCHCPSLYCHCPQPHVTRHGSHLLWQEHQGFVACLASVHQMRGNRSFSSPVAVQMFSASHPCNPLCCYLTS